MKLKSVLVFFICLALVLVPQAFNKSPIFKSGEDYTIYSGALGSNAKITICDKGKEFLTKIFTSYVTGESTTYSNTQTAFSEAKRLGAKILFSESVQNVTCYYAYTPKINNCVTLYGEKINIQIAVSESYSKIGTPLIFGSF